MPLSQRPISFKRKHALYSQMKVFLGQEERGGGGGMIPGRTI